MKALVTGGAGFIGSHIVDALVEAGHDVTVVDDLSTGRREQVNSAARFVELDIRDAALADLFSSERFDVVSHQAARCDVRASVEDPFTYEDVNVHGGVNLLECCREFGIGKFIFASTGGAIYGEAQRLPTDEEHPLQPLDPYGASKAAFELYLHAYAVNYGLDYTVLRYPNVYGPRQDPFGEAGVVAIFIGQMLRSEQVIINGDGEQQRDFLHVSEVVRANLLALENGSASVYNLGWGVGISVNHIFRTLKSMTGYGLDAIHGPARAGEVRHSCLDAARARRELGWEPAVRLEAGLQNTVEYFEGLLTPREQAGSHRRGET